MTNITQHGMQKKLVPFTQLPSTMEEAFSLSIKSHKHQVEEKSGLNMALINLGCLTSLCGARFRIPRPRFFIGVDTKSQLIGGRTYLLGFLPQRKDIKRELSTKK